jgi:hypothetical protein
MYSQAELAPILQNFTSKVLVVATQNFGSVTMNPLASFLTDLKLSASQSCLDFSLDDAVGEDSSAIDMDITIVSDNARIHPQDLSESFSSLSFSLSNDLSSTTRSMSSSLRSSMTTSTRTPSPYEFSPETRPSVGKSARKHHYRHEDMDVTRRATNSSHHRRETTPFSFNIACSKGDSRWEAFEGKKSPDIILRRPKRNVSSKQMREVKAPPLYSMIMPTRKQSLESEASEHSQQSYIRLHKSVPAADASIARNARHHKIPPKLRKLPYKPECDESGNEYQSLQTRSVTPVTLPCDL